MAKKYCFRYLYDGMGNVCKAYIPGRDEPDITAYDSSGRPEASSTAAMRSDDIRDTYLYDGLGRVTAVQTSATTGALRDNMLYLYDSYSTSPEWLGHSFRPVEGVVAQSDILAVPRGMKTHERVYEVYDKSSTVAARSSQRTFYYDMRGRIVQSVETSPMGRTVRVSCKYDYTGNTLIRHEQYTIGGTTTVVVYTYAYDSRGRVTAETTAVDGEQITDIAYSYDELGQLKTVTAGSDIETSYTYNIQGWLTKKSTDKSILKPRLASINSGLIIDRDSLIMPPGGIAESLQKNIFEQTLEYFSPKYAQPRYAGNIAETSWKRGSNAEADTYAYTYDRLGRLVDGRFISGGQLLTKQYGERNISYDKNTNILSLTRYNGSRIGTQYRYTYDGNRKQTLTSGTSTQTAASYGYQYDIMGNISKIGAENLLISYNYLNLPKIITKTGTPRSSGAATYVIGVTRPTASYIYLADGTKVQATGETGQGYEYLGSLRLSVNGSSVDIESIPFAGGRIVKTSNGYEPQYYITDHLGSTRTVVKPNATVVAEFDYMPYGTQHAVAGAPIAEADYKYTGKEQQTAFGLGNLYDSQARFQYVKDGMFLSHDPLSATFSNTSPYMYCGGDPINRVDPTGTKIDDPDSIYDNHRKHIEAQIENLQSAKKKNRDIANLIDRVIREYKTIISEYDALERSDMIYKIGYWSEKGGGTSYDNGIINIKVGRNKLPGIMAHELKHAYQYETGALSFEVYDGKVINYGSLYDITDETEAYNRARIVNNGIWYYLNPEADGEWSDDDVRRLKDGDNTPYAELQPGPINIDFKYRALNLLNRIRNESYNVYHVCDDFYRKFRF